MLAPALLAPCLAIADGAPSPSAAVLADSTQHGFMWEARKGGRHAYLMGTLHVGVSSDYPPAAAIVHRLSEVDAIVLEDDISQQERSQAAAAKWAIYPGAEPGLEQRIDPALRDDCERQLARYGVPAAAAWRMKPWMLAMQLVLLDGLALGYSPENATEVYLVKLARSGHKPIVELEGIEAQLRMLDSSPLPDQIEFLRQTVHSLESGEAETELQELVAAWRGSDVAAMLKYLDQVRHSPERAEREWFDRLVTRRNADMAASIDQLLQDGHFYLVAVGSLHFFGDDGLVEQLRRRGYTVTVVGAEAAP